MKTIYVKNINHSVNSASQWIPTEHILTKEHRKTDNHTAQEKPTGSTIIPYAPGISEKLRRIGNKYGIRTAFR